MQIPSSIASLAHSQAGIMDAAGHPLYRAGLRGLIDRVGISTLLYCIALVIWLIMTLLDATYFKIYIPGLVHKTVRLVCLFILVISEYLDWKLHGFSRRAIIAFLITCLFIMVALVATVRMQIDAALFVFCARNRNFSLLAKVFFLTATSMLIVIVVCSFFGIIENTLVQSGRERAYLGFRYALYPAACLLSITLLSLYLTDRRFFLPVAALLAVANVAMYFFTDSRLSSALAFAAIILVILFRHGVPKAFCSKAAGILFVVSFGVVAIFSVVVTVLYNQDNDTLAMLNNILGNRLAYGHQALEEYGVPLIGQTVDLVGNGLSKWGTKTVGEYFYVDNIYIRLLVEYGIIVFVIHVVAYSLCTFKAWKANNIPLTVALLVLALHGAVDNLMLYLWYNPFILLWGVLLSDNQSTMFLDLKRGKHHA